MRKRQIRFFLPKPKVRIVAPDSSRERIIQDKRRAEEKKRLEREVVMVVGGEKL